jgi:hypothetical protein
MNKKLQLGRAGLRTARRHPRGTVRVSVFAVRHWRSIVTAAALLRRTSGALRHSKVVADPSVNAESRRALHELARAARRARRIGITRAVGDERVGRRLSRASRHATKAVAAARQPRHRGHTTMRKAAAVLTLGLVGATVYHRRLPSE